MGEGGERRGAVQGDSHAHWGPRPPFRKQPGQSPRSPGNRLPTLASPRLGALAGDCWTPTPAPPGLRPTEKQRPAAPYAIPKLTPTPRDSRRRPALNRKRPPRSHFPARRDPPYGEGPRGQEPATSTSVPARRGCGCRRRRGWAQPQGARWHRVPEDRAICRATPATATAVTVCTVMSLHRDALGAPLRGEPALSMAPRV